MIFRLFSTYVRNLQEKARTEGVDARTQSHLHGSQSVCMEFIVVIPSLAGSNNALTGSDDA